MKTKKTAKILSILLSVMMLFGAIPLAQVAADVSSRIVDGINGGIIYVGDWTKSFSRSDCIGSTGAYVWADSSNKYFSYTFTGTGLAYYSPVDVNQGQVEIWIDGVLEGTVITNGTKANSAKLWEKLDLPPGTHTVIGKAKPYNGQPYVFVDQLELFGYVPAATTLSSKLDFENGVAYDSVTGRTYSLTKKAAGTDAAAVTDATRGGKVAHFINSGIDLGNIDYTDSFTYTMWYKTVSSSGDQSYFGNQDFDSGNNDGFSVHAASTTNASARFCLDRDMNGGTGNDDFAVTVSSFNVWNHYAVSFDRTTGTVTFYLNGAKMGSRVMTRSIGQSIQSRYSTVLGINPNTAYGPNLDWYCDDFMRFTGVLNDQQVSNVYNGRDFNDSTPKAAIKMKFEDNVKNEISGSAMPSTGTFNYTKGITGKAAIFKNGNFVDLGNIDYTNSFSYSMWVNLQSVSSDPVFLGNQNWNSGGNIGWNLNFKNGDGRVDHLVTTAGGRNDVYPAFTLETARWTHIAFTFNRATGKVTYYLDGVQVNTQTLANTVGQTLASGLTTKLGQDGTGTYGAKPDMIIDEFGYYTSELTASDISALYNQVINVSAGPLQPSYFSFDGNLANENAYVDGKSTAPEYADGKFDHGVKLSTPQKAVSFESIQYENLFSFAAYVKPVGAVTAGTALFGNKAAVGDNTTGWMLSFGAQNGLTVKFGDNAAAHYPNVFTAGQFTHIALTVDKTNSSAILYINGVAQTPIVLSAGVSLSAEGKITMLGGTAAGTDNTTPFICDELYLTNTVYTAQQIGDIYNKTVTPSEISFVWVAGENAVKNTYYTVDLHLYAPGNPKVYSYVDFNLSYDSSAMVLTQTDKAGMLSTVDGHYRVTLNKSLKNADYNVNFNDTFVARFVFKTNTVTGNYPISLTGVGVYEGSSAVTAIPVAADHIVNAPALNTTILDTKANDLNGDGVIGIGDVALAAAEQKNAVASEAAIFPYKRVFMLTMDGGGIAFDPNFPSNFYLHGSKARDRVNPYAMNLFNQMSSASYNVRAVYPAWSAPNYGAMLHGYGYNGGIDYRTTTGSGEWYLENGLAGRKYFNKYASGERPSIFKLLKDADPTRALTAITCWESIQTGIIEPDLGIGMQFSWGAYTEYRSDGTSYPASGFNDLAVTNNIVDYVNSGKMKNTALLFSQWDEVDHDVHDYGVYSPQFWSEVARHDNYYQRIVEAFQNNSLFNDTLFIFNADHGGDSSTGHGTNDDYNLRTMYALMGDTIDNTRQLANGGNMSTTPATILHALRQSNLKPASMSESVVFDPAAFLSQKQMSKKARGVEKVTLKKHLNEMECVITGVSSSVTAAQMIFNLPAGATNVTVKPAAGYTVVKSELSGTTLDVVVSGTAALTEGQIVASVTYDGYDQNVANLIYEVNLGTADGKEIYCDLDEVKGLTSKFGDLDSDGQISVKDLIIMKKLQAETLPTERATAELRDIADINRDGVSDATDLSTLRKILLGLPI